MFVILGDPSPTTLLPGDEATVSIRYLPTEFGTHRAALVIESNDVRGLPPVGLIGRRDTATVVPEVREIDFPRLASCAQPVTRELRIRNDIGTVPAEITEVSTRIGDAFSVVGTPPESLAPLGGERIIEIRFTPPDDGDFLDTLVIEGGPCGITELVILRGSRRPPELTASSSSYDFGSLYLCDRTADSTELRLTNSGEITDTLFGAVQSGDGVFTIAGSDGAPVTWPVILEPGEEFDVRVKFVPTSSGNFNGEISFEWGPCQRSNTIALAGRSVEPAVELSTDLIEFGEVEVDAPGVRRTFLFSNRSSLTRMISRVDFGAVAGEFRLVDPLPLPVTVPPGGSIMFEIEFDPTGSRSYSDFATLTIDAPCPQELRLGVTGKGIGDDEFEGELLLAIPDYLDGAIDETTEIPIVVRRTSGLGEIGIGGVDLALYWAAPLLYPEGLTTTLEGWNGEIIESGIVGERRRLRVSFSGDRQLLSGDTLGFISALVLLGDRDTTDITIELIDVTMPPSSRVTVTLEHGSFSAFGICPIDGDRLLASRGPLRLGAPTPNPGSEIIEIPIGIERSGRLVISLYDALGILRNRPVDREMTRGQFALPIDISSLANGLYICRLEFDGNVMERQIVVKR